MEISHQSPIELDMTDIPLRSQMSTSAPDFTSRARNIRLGVLDLSLKAQTPHIGSSLSCVDILEAILSSEDYDFASDLNELVLSKGHAAPALYCALSEHGFITREQLGTFAQPGSPLEEHPNHLIPGVSTPSGSLGHGLPFAAGYVLAGAKDGNLRRAVVIMSDGECNEGTVWESAIFAGARGLEGITVVVDANKWQATGRTSESFGSIAIADMFKAAQWSVKEIDGHSEEAIKGALRRIPEDSNKPMCIVAKTVKGKGVSFMEDDNNWHYRTLSEDEHALACKDLESTN